MATEWNYARWAYETGRGNLKAHLETGDFLLAQANTLLTLLLAGLGGALAMGSRVFEPAAGVLGWGAAAVAVWLSLVAAVLARQCIVTRNTQVVDNEPINVYKPILGLSEEEILSYEIENLQGRINITKARNEAVARWLDRCRYAAIATPFSFAVGALGEIALAEALVRPCV